MIEMLSCCEGKIKGILLYVRESNIMIQLNLIIC
jgi:hypothetical protein